jgi:hypothetical protein
MFSTQGQEVKTGGGSKSLTPGVVNAHILSGSIRTSSKGDKKVLDLLLEGEIVPNFEGWPIDKDNLNGPKYAGPIGKVTATVYTAEFNNQDLNKNEILGKLVAISQELGLRKEIDNIGQNETITSIEQWVDRAIDILKGHDINWFLKGTEEEYNGKTIVKLSLPKYKFASADKSKLDVYDKSNIYHYKALAPSVPVASFDAGSDFDM